MPLLDALPSYLGAKTAQAPRIFEEVAAAGLPPMRGHVILDAFAGGCSVALMGKAMGYRVIANDASPRSEAIGKAVLENDRFTLSDADVAMALTTDPAGWYLPPLKHLPWPEDPRRLLASIAKCAEGMDSPHKRHLMRAWLVKFATAISIYGQPRMTVHQRIRDKNWDAMTPGMVDRILEPQTKPRKFAMRAARDLNAAVFPNGQRNEMHRLDVLDFLSGRPGDVAYLDPPYPDTEGYGRNYAGIDAVLENREIEPDEGRFATATGWRFLGEVLDAAEHIPTVLLSLGAEVRHVSAGELVELMRERGRHVDPHVLEYGLLKSRATSKSDKKREYLLIGTKTSNTNRGKAPEGAAHG